MTALASELRLRPHQQTDSWRRGQNQIERIQSSLHGLQRLRGRLGVLDPSNIEFAPCLMELFPLNANSTVGRANGRLLVPMRGHFVLPVR